MVYEKWKFELIGTIRVEKEPEEPKPPEPEPVLVETYKYIQIWMLNNIYYVKLDGVNTTQYNSIEAARLAIDNYLNVPVLVEIYRSVEIWREPDGVYHFMFNGIDNRWQTLEQAKAQIDEYLDIQIGNAVRVNPLPWSGWTYWHNTWVQESHVFDPTQARLMANDIGVVPASGLSLAILRQELDIPLKGHDYWLRFTVMSSSLINQQNWLRAAIVARIDRLSGGESDSRYTEYDFYQGINTHPNSGGNFKWILVDKQIAEEPFKTYKVHLTQDLINHWGLTLHDSYRLNYLAPTLEFRNAGMTIFIKDVELWEGDPSPGE